MSEELTAPGAEAPAQEQQAPPADIERLVAERVEAELKRREQQAARERKKAEEEALARQAEWQRLAEQRGQELETVRAKAEAAERYAQRLNALIEQEIASWPEEVKALDPGKDDLDARLAWLERSRALARRLLELPKAPDTDAGKGQQPAAQQTISAPPGGRYRFQQPGDVPW